MLEENLSNAWYADIFNHTLVCDPLPREDRIIYDKHIKCNGEEQKRIAYHEKKQIYKIAWLCRINDSIMKKDILSCIKIIVKKEDTRTYN